MVGRKGSVGSFFSSYVMTLDILHQVLCGGLHLCLKGSEEMRADFFLLNIYLKAP